MRQGNEVIVSLSRPETVIPATHPRFLPYLRHVRNMYIHPQRTS